MFTSEQIKSRRDRRCSIKLGLIRLVCTAVMAVTILSCAGSDIAAGMSPGINVANGSTAQGMTISTADALAELDGLVPAPGVDPQLHSQLQAALREGLAAAGTGRFTVTVATSSGSSVTDLRLWNNGDGTAQCRFSYVNEGDYNQDSQVTASDITPLGQYYARVEGAADWTRAALADGNSDGQVAVSDITPIGQQYGKSINGYVLESTETPQVAGSWQELARLSFESSTLPAEGGRRQFVYNLPDPVVGKQYRVIPFLGETTGAEGAPAEYSGEIAPAFVINGTCRDGSGAPLAGVELTLAGMDPVITAADGTYLFAGVPDGLSAELIPHSGNLLFIPEAIVITISNTSQSGLAFTGLSVTALETNLPVEGDQAQPVKFELRAVDGSGQPVMGFSTTADLTSSPGGMQVILAPVFTNGVAPVSVSFAAPGDYLLAVAGLHAELAGPIGSIEITTSQPPELSVAKWQGNAEAAISLSFDDGTEDHWTRGMGLWEEYGFCVTLGILKRNFTDNPTRIPQLQEAFDAGHEIANHTSTHTDLTTLSNEAVAAELQGCNDYLVSNISGLERIDTVIYPYEEFNDAVISVVSEGGYLFARSGYQGISDYAQLNDSWSPPFHHLYSWANQDVLPLSMWNSTTDWTLNHGDWLVEQCHGIGSLGEPGVGWSPRPEQEYRAHFDHLSSLGERLWIAPIREVGCYLIERNNAQFEVLDFTGSQLDFILFDALDNSIFNVPLTVMLELPADWPGAVVTQGMTSLLVTNRDGMILFDVRPGSGSVSVRKT